MCLSRLPHRHELSDLGLTSASRRCTRATSRPGERPTGTARSHGGQAAAAPEKVNHRRLGLLDVLCRENVGRDRDSRRLQSLELQDGGVTSCLEAEGVQQLETGATLKCTSFYLSWTGDAGAVWIFC